MCHYMILGAQVAREMIEAGEYEDVVSKWAAENKRRWEKSKFFKLWEKERRPVVTRTRRSRTGGGSRETVGACRLAVAFPCVLEEARAVSGTAARRGRKLAGGRYCRLWPT